MSHQFVKFFEVKFIVYISCIFLSKLFLLINDIYICRTRVFKIVLFLTLLNYLRLFKSTKIIYTSKNVFFQKKKNYPKIWGLSLVGGPRRWPKWPRPRAGPVYMKASCWNSFIQCVQFVWKKHQSSDYAMCFSKMSTEGQNGPIPSIFEIFSNKTLFRKLLGIYHFFWYSSLVSSSTIFFNPPWHDDIKSWN